MHVCCGGIVGMGEIAPHARGADRAAREHGSVSRNRCRSTTWCRSRARRCTAPRALDPFEFVRTIACARITMPKAMVRLSAGRQEMSEGVQALCFLAGANSIFYGEKLLTTGNPEVERDRALFAKLGLRPMAARWRARRRDSPITHFSRMPFAALAAELAELDARGLTRTRRVLRIAAGRARHGRRPRLRRVLQQRLSRARRASRARSRRRARARRATASAPAHRTSSSGTARAHHALEERARALRRACRARCSSPSGYMANLGIVTALAGARRRGVRRPAESCVAERRGAALARRVQALSAPRSRRARAPAGRDRARGASSSSPTRCSAWTATSRRCRSCSRSRSATTPGSCSTTRTASACSGARGRGVLEHFGAALAAHRLHGDARQGRGRVRRVRRRREPSWSKRSSSARAPTSTPPRRRRSSRTRS